MAVIVLMLTIWITQLTSANGNFYSTSHDSYMTSTLNLTAFSMTNISGGVDVVSQQCRRMCALDSICKAFQVELLQNELELGLFRCSFFDLNACDWQSTRLQNTSSTAVFSRLWDKLDAAALPPKPCIEYCAVKSGGNCTLCRGLSNFTGLDCEIPPMLCSNYTMTPSDQWKTYTIWPWGFGGRNLTVSCRNRATLIIMNKQNINYHLLRSLGRFEYTDSLTSFMAVFKTIDWPLIAELQSLSTEKKLIVSVTLNTTTLDYTFGGFKISPIGELSLKASLDTPISTGFPLPLYNAPFMVEPLGFDTTCGPFWRFNEASVICEQRTKLFNFGTLKWDGVTSTSLGIAALSFQVAFLLEMSCTFG